MHKTQAPQASEPEETLVGRLVDAAVEAELATGRREETVEEARRSVVRRMGRMTAGSFLVLLGIVLWVLPGPGLLTIAAGLVLLSRDFPWAARMLDRVRARLPQDEHGQTHRGVIAASVTVAVLSIGFSVWFMIA